MRLLAAVLAASLSLLAPPASSSSAPAPLRVTVTTANVRNIVTTSQARADVRRAIDRSSVVLLQEMWHRRVTGLVPASWGVFHPSTPVGGCRDNAIVWDRSVWRLVRGYGFRLHYVSGLVGNCAAVAILEHRTTGRILPAIGVHLLPHVEVAGRPRPLPRVRTYHASIDRIRDRAAGVTSRRGSVLIGGDWNVDYPADRRVQSRPFPFRHFHAAYDSQWGVLPRTLPTLGSRRIDGFWWSANGTIRPIASRTIRGTYSDHNFVRTTLELR